MHGYFGDLLLESIEADRRHKIIQRSLEREIVDREARALNRWLNADKEIMKAAAEAVSEGLARELSKELLPAAQRVLASSRTQERYPKLRLDVPPTGGPLILEGSIPSFHWRIQLWDFGA